ncbi:PREDICTED: uncharacterized protein C17orf59 homolog, partial [Ficedula albicollis]|uniref:uncharacterized protein C17orf59 homolog n=1 Tax=Ficedula albicollis TaxID=59894 RepID=UPI0003594B02
PSGAPRGEPPAGGGGSSIPAIDPGALQDVVALAGQVAAQVDELLRNVHCGLQALTALSVGCIQTYRDGVESLGEAADLSIRAMYALVARCEELDRAMQPVPALAKRIRDMKGTLERLEGLCKSPPPPPPPAAPAAAPPVPAAGAWRRCALAPPLAASAAPARTSSLALPVRDLPASVARSPVLVWTKGNFCDRRKKGSRLKTAG